MYLKSMLKFCKKARIIKIEYHGNQKFLTDDEMKIYLFFGSSAKWNSKDFAMMLELDDDTIEKFTMEDSEPGEYDAFEVAEMQSVEKLIYSVNIYGTSYQPFMLPDDKIFLVDMTRLSVFKDFYPKRYFYQSGELVVAKDNLVIGTISPTRTNLDTMKNFTSQLHNRKPTIQKLMDKGLLKGDENGRLGLTMDAIRIFVANDRAGLYD